MENEPAGAAQAGRDALAQEFSESASRSARTASARRTAAGRVENGAPLRVRVERQLGYKMPKYIHRDELVDSFAALGFGEGGYWEDRGHDWYGGI